MIPNLEPRQWAFQHYRVNPFYHTQGKPVTFSDVFNSLGKWVNDAVRDQDRSPEALEKKFYVAFCLSVILNQKIKKVFRKIGSGETNTYIYDPERRAIGFTEASLKSFCRLINEFRCRSISLEGCRSLGDGVLCKFFTDCLEKTELKEIKIPRKLTAIEMQAYRAVQRRLQRVVEVLWPVEIKYATGKTIHAYQSIATPSSEIPARKLEEPFAPPAAIKASEEDVQGNWPVEKLYETNGESGLMAPQIIFGKLETWRDTHRLIAQVKWYDESYTMTWTNRRELHEPPLTEEQARAKCEQYVKDVFAEKMRGKTDAKIPRITDIPAEEMGGKTDAGIPLNSQAIRKPLPPIPQKRAARTPAANAVVPAAALTPDRTAINVEETLEAK